MSLATRSIRYADSVDAAQRELDVLFGRFFGNANGNGQPVASFPVDVSENQDTLTVETDLPGFAKEEVDITLENSVLKIAAERKTPAQPEPVATEGTAHESKANYLLKERRYTRLERSFRLPQTVDGSTVNARLENGVLTVTLNKRQETKPRKIAVS